MNATDPYNHIEYMESIAANLKVIAHSRNNQRFFKSTGLASLDGLIARIGCAKLPAIVAEDQSDQNIIDNTSDNILAKPYYTFYVLYPAKAGNDDSIFEARKNGLKTAKKIISRMRKDAREQVYGLKDLNVGSFKIMGIGPIGDQGHGVQVTFTLIEDSDTYYNESDWVD